jgi:hypothetical protein
LIGQYNLMCDLHLAIHMFLYVYVVDSVNPTAKFWLAPGCSRQLG